MKEFIKQLKILFIGIFSIVAILLILSRNATPLSPFTFQIKRLQEKVFMKFKSDPQSQLKYNVFLLDERLKDLRSVAGADDPSYILSTSLRYSTTAGQITELVKANGLKDQIPGVLELFRSHSAAISKLVDAYPKDTDEEWKFVQDDVNYLQIYSQMLKEQI